MLQVAGGYRWAFKGPSEQLFGERGGKVKITVNKTCKRSSSIVAASVKGNRTKEEEAVLSGNQLRCHPWYFMMMPCNVISVYILIHPFSKRSGRIRASSVPPTLFSLLMSASGRQAQTSNCLCQSDRQL